MEDVNSSRYRRLPRGRARAAAVVLVAAVSICGGPVAAAGELAEVADVEVADVEVAAGQTVVLQPEDGRTYTVADDNTTPLPAGWSVITEKGGLRITAPATASPAEFATVRVTEHSGEAGTFRVTVEGEPEPEPPADGSSSAWFNRLAGRVASLFRG